MPGFSVLYICGMAAIAIIDNYDSFTYNLVHYAEDIGAEVTVFRNDAFVPEELEGFDGIIISPGPGLPASAGRTMEVIGRYYTRKPLFGVCLGQQAIAAFFGGRLKNLSRVYHGVASTISVVKDDPLFRGVPEVLQVGRYHSWTVEAEGLPDQLLITSIDEHGEIMSLRHREYDLCSVQFHPESILTPYGRQIMKNWVDSLGSSQSS